MIKKSGSFYLILFMAFMALGVKSVFSGMLDQDIPLPRDAQEMMNKSANFGPSPVALKAYETSLSDKGIASFYKSEMKKRGWVERASLFFIKDDMFVNLGIVPIKPSSGKTRFTVASGKMFNEEAIKQMEKDTPDTLNFMPLYPKAKQKALMDTPTGLIASYSVDSSIKDVISFYKSKMPQYGWVLSEETPVKVRKVDDCPACRGGKDAAAKATEPSMKGESYSGRLVFTRLKSQACIINIYEQRVNVQQASTQKEGAAGTVAVQPASIGLDPTIIAVSFNDYQKKK